MNEWMNELQTTGQNKTKISMTVKLLKIIPDTISNLT